MTDKEDKSYSDEISIKDIIFTIQDYWKELLRNWFLIGLFCIPFGLYFLYQHFTTPPEYKAGLSYMVNSNEDNSMAGFASLLGSFGLNRGNQGLSLDKLIELSKSRAIVQNTLFNKIPLDGEEQYISNAIIDIYDYHEEWSEIDDFKEFYFTHSKIDSFSKVENKVLKMIYSRIVGNSESGVKGLMSSGYNENSGILGLTFQSQSEVLSEQFANIHFEELKNFFINKTIEKQQLNYEIMKQKTDSLQAELRTTEYELANFKDSNLGIYTKKDNLTELRLEGKIKMLYAGLAKAIENLEIADFTLKYQTPFIQTIDRPVIPLQIVRTSIIGQLIKSILLGCLLGIAFVLIRKLYRDAIS